MEPSQQQHRLLQSPAWSPSTPSTLNFMSDATASEVLWTLDDLTVASLYLPFPEDYDDDAVARDRRTIFWLSAIRRYCLEKKVAVVYLEQLTLDFQRNGQVPQCLPMILQHMCRIGLVRKLSTFIPEPDSQRETWTVKDFVSNPIACTFKWLIMTPTTWAFRRMISSKRTFKDDSDDCSLFRNLDVDRYVLVDLVKEFARQIFRRHVLSASTSGGQGLVSLAHLFSTSESIVTDELSFRLAMHHLKMESKCLITAGDDGQKVVRMLSTEEDFIPPSNTELKLFRLRAVSRQLENCIKSIADEMERFMECAREKAYEGNRQQAMRYLKKRKMLEPIIDQKELSLDRIFALIVALEQTETSKQILDAYNLGVEAFKSLKSSSGLSAEDIDKRMLDVQEMLEDREELQRSMSLAFSTPLVPCDDDLETELERLMDDDRSPRRASITSAFGIGDGATGHVRRPSNTPEGVDQHRLQVDNLESSPFRLSTQRRFGKCTRTSFSDKEAAAVTTSSRTLQALDQ